MTSFCTFWVFFPSSLFSPTDLSSQSEHAKSKLPSYILSSINQLFGWERKKKKEKKEKVVCIKIFISFFSESSRFFSSLHCLILPISSSKYNTYYMPPAPSILKLFLLNTNSHLNTCIPHQLKSMILISLLLITYVACFPTQYLASKLPALTSLPSLTNPSMGQIFSFPRISQLPQTFTPCKSKISPTGCSAQKSNNEGCKGSGIMTTKTALYSGALNLFSFSACSSCAMVNPETLSLCHN